ncbi:hypothetical protein [Streptomyces sp. NPDC127112]|uniref:hypothetical protein n=1 Tax=Streptomyces sp. NPDC127112 TaxID=3345364 RepID=UPI0036318024
MRLLTADKTAKKMVRRVELEGDARFTFKGMDADEYAASFTEYHSGHPCHKCGGLGSLLGYSHIERGVCFSCNGDGLSGEITVTREYVVLSRAFLEYMDNGPAEGQDFFDYFLNYPPSNERTVTVQW